MSTSSDIADLSMMQLADSFFPTGMYTTSNGLEALFYSGKKLKVSELFALVKIFIEHQMGPADCAALGNAYEYASKSDVQNVIRVDKILHSMKLVQEIRNASARSGTQMLRCTNFFVTENTVLNEYAAAIKSGHAFGPYPVALAVACNALSIPKRKAGLAMLYSFSVGMVGAALRLGMFQHFEGQKIIDELKPVIVRTVNENIGRPVEGMWQFAPQIDIVQMSHEKMASKMFIT
ncbi:urease accessory protein UreF [Candidatus Nitrososphaera evergladensis SR1]|uniref:Urease accessory protein UreF n=1 Tax=Candidatus Nitrososphaera evergladensis SR1 TaxID=1459636 RepID=A0A075N0A0_9ARCH|nr:urease accessory UreF family protein [Candidatus Nitrososphaera evergladensis]AIF84924.1 urease accessory protein UreF [Candidatus Nitrososphaera evergladensis SR1]